MLPRFTHDCDNCKFVGHLDSDYRKKGDIYICIHTKHQTDLTGGSLIVRYSNEPSDYSSLDIEVLADHYLNRNRQ